MPAAAPSGARPPGRRRLLRLSAAQALTVARGRLLWDRRAESWDTDGSQGLTAVVEAVVARARVPAPEVAVDLGAGSGQVTLPLAPSCGRVVAVDVSEPSLRRLEGKAREAGIGNIDTVTAAMEQFDLAPASVDLVVSNYALHHLRDPDKAAVIGRSHAWLRPGGRLVIGDMMFGRGSEHQDRTIIRSKVTAMARRGPAGWWRVAKNVWRFGLRVGEKPLPPARWQTLVADAGFSEVTVTRVVSEACVLTAVKAPRPTQGP